ncbi:hypothetical protein HY971_04755 [Candidatus Kaiserbacteria bacterium]|nr:hypothetical protein [Candidatus Kaiserbacteria bacterium]
MDIFAFFTFLRRRRVIFLLLFLLAWLVFLDLLWLLPTRESVRLSASELSMQMAENASSNLSSSLEDILTRVQNASLDIQAESDRTQKIIGRLLQRNPLFVNVAVVDRSGIELMRAGQFTAEDNLREYSKMSGLYLALAGSSSFSDILHDESTGPASLVMVPIKEPDGIHAVLVVDVNLELLAKIVEPPKAGTWQIYITDKKGNEIIGSDASAAGEHSFLEHPVVQKVAVDGQIADGLSAEDPYVNDRGVRVFVVGRPIPITNWSLFVERPESEALRESFIVTWLALAILVLGLLSIIVALWSYWRQAVLNERLSTQGLDLLKKNEQLLEVDKVKSNFIGVAAHQLRTPLSAIKWTLGLLIDDTADNLTPEQKGLLLKSFEHNERIIGLINEMLVVARIESGNIQLKLTPIHIEDLIESTMIDFENQAKARKVELVFERPPTHIPLVSVDPEQIRGVIQNLLENALRYTPDGGSVHALATVVNGMAQIAVKDSGIGIPEGQRSSIFNKFFRADNAVKRHADGSGLGLFIAKNIIEKHGGTLTFTSTEGRGTTFYFTLPLGTTAPTS